MSTREPFKYGPRVKVSNWNDSALSDPKDNKHPKRAMESHYRTFGISDEVYVPKTSTQESLDSVENIAKTCNRIVTRSEVNFTSYPMNDFRFENVYLKTIELIQETKDVPETSYNEFYKPPYAIIKKKDYCKEPLDPLFNRIPKNDFEMLPSSTNKFMDDHLMVISEGRKKINYFRQMKNASNIFL